MSEFCVFNWTILSFHANFAYSYKFGDSDKTILVLLSNSDFLPQPFHAKTKVKKGQTQNCFDWKHVSWGDLSGSAANSFCPILRISRLRIHRCQCRTVVYFRFAYVTTAFFIAVSFTWRKYGLFCTFFQRFEAENMCKSP